MISVHDYFTSTFGEEPREASLRDLALDSACGEACRRVIDAGKVYYDLADPHPDVREPFLAWVNAALEVLWIG